jgi:type I restriction enzyme, R subunit
LAHRLSTLFKADIESDFHKIVVITDRLVLDRQLQRTTVNPHLPNPHGCP